MTEPPTAEVVGVRARYATIVCPYCKRKHRHKLRAHGAQWFAPSCGLNLNPEQRAQGYRFNTMEENK